jgi:excisionase family DNA binding protein
VPNTIEDLILGAVKSALRDSIDDLRPAITEAVKDAIAGGQAGAPAPYVLVKEAARIMSAHPATVRKLITQGELGRYSVRGQIRVKLSDVHAYLARQGNGSPTISLQDRALEILGASRRDGT